MALSLKGTLKAEIRPAEKTLWSLQNGTALDNKISKYIQVRLMLRVETEIQKIPQMFSLQIFSGSEECR